MSVCYPQKNLKFDKEEQMTIFYPFPGFSVAFVDRFEKEFVVVRFPTGLVGAKEVNKTCCMEGEALITFGESPGLPNCCA